MSVVTPHLAPAHPDLVWFGGADAMRFLNDLVSQEIGPMEAGAVRRSMLLTPQGKLDHLLWVLKGEESVGLVVDEGRGDSLAATLSRYRIRVDVEIERSPIDTWVVAGPDDQERGRWSGDALGLRADVSWPLLQRTLVVGERPELPDLDRDEYTRLRIESGEPVPGVDVDDSTIPQETGLVPATISFEKGCFLGQELVARLDSRGGRVNHHLRILRFDGEAPATGADVLANGEPVGRLTSAAGDLGLARLRRGVEPGDTVLVGEMEAVVAAVPES